MTVTRVFSIRILLTLPRTIFICNQTLPRSLPARRMNCRWENETLMAHRESSPGNSTLVATKHNRRSSCRTRASVAVNS